MWHDLNKHFLEYLSHQNQSFSMLKHNQKEF